LIALEIFNAWSNYRAFHGNHKTVFSVQCARTSFNIIFSNTKSYWKFNTYSISTVVHYFQNTCGKLFHYKMFIIMRNSWFHKVWKVDKFICTKKHTFDENLWKWKWWNILWKDFTTSDILLNNTNCSFHQITACALFATFKKNIQKLFLKLCIILTLTCKPRKICFCQAYLSLPCLRFTL
jgi:hypothetical protein